MHCDFSGGGVGVGGGGCLLLLFFLDAPKLRSHAYLSDPLAPGPAEALEDMHCHVTRVLSSQRVQGLGHLRAPSAWFNSTPPFVRLFRNK